MNMYMRISAHIYGIYLKYIASEDIHVYSIDEVFINASLICLYTGKPLKNLP